MTTRYDQGQKIRRKLLANAHVRSRDTISLRERSTVTPTSPAPTTPSPRKSMRKWRVQLSDPNRLIPHNCVRLPVPCVHNRFDIRPQDNRETIFLDM